MREHHSRRGGTALLRLAVIVFLPAVLLVTGGTPVSAAHHQGRHRIEHGRVETCLLAGSRKQGVCTRHAAHAIWNHWCRHEVSCAAAHLYLRPHFGLRGSDGFKIKSLPEGKWIRRFVRVGWAYHISPSILMAIGLVESYGGTTSTAYMGCLRPG